MGGKKSAESRKSLGGRGRGQAPRRMIPRLHRRASARKLNSNTCLNSMSRPSEYTRNSIMKAAVALFAERGYNGTSIRAIVSKARVNQAAINYHFKGKEGLYFEVLKVAFEGYLRLDNFDPERLKDMPREEALRQFVHQQL